MIRPTAKTSVVLCHVIFIVGVFVFPTAFFGGWHTYETVEEKFNDYSWLIGGCGLCALLSGLTIRELLRRIEELEKKVDQASRSGP